MSKSPPSAPATEFPFFGLCNSLLFILGSFLQREREFSSKSLGRSPVHPAVCQRKPRTAVVTAEPLGRQAPAAQSPAACPMEVGVGQGPGGQGRITRPPAGDPQGQGQGAGLEREEGLTLRDDEKSQQDPLQTEAADKHRRLILSVRCGNWEVTFSLPSPLSRTCRL